MSLSRHLTYFTAALSLMLGACQHGLSQPSLSDEKMKITVLEQSLLCPMAQSGITEITSSKQWSRLLGTSPLSEPVVLPKTWLEQYRLFAVSFGSQPSAGYGIQVVEEAQLAQSETGQNQLNITAVLTTPAKGSMTAQMMTSPCVLVGAPKGDYAAQLIAK